MFSNHIPKWRFWGVIGPAVDDAPKLTPLILSSTSYTAYLKEKDEYFKAR